MSTYQEDQHPDIYESDPTEEFIEVFQARDDQEAQRIRELLEDHDIPAIIGDEDQASLEDELPILVPEEFCEEAQLIIAETEDYEELFDPEDQEYSAEDDGDEPEEESFELLDEDDQDLDGDDEMDPLDDPFGDEDEEELFDDEELL
ncbi:MAG: putative signal transducing protein [Phycisphaerae bacterium]